MLCRLLNYLEDTNVFAFFGLDPIHWLVCGGCFTMLVGVVALVVVLVTRGNKGGLTYDPPVLCREDSGRGHQVQALRRVPRQCSRCRQVN